MYVSVSVSFFSKICKNYSSIYNKNYNCVIVKKLQQLTFLLLHHKDSH